MVATENKAINPDLEQYGKAGRKLNGGKSAAVTRSSCRTRLRLRSLSNR